MTLLAVLIVFALGFTAGSVYTLNDVRRSRRDRLELRMLDAYRVKTWWRA